MATALLIAKTLLILLFVLTLNYPTIACIVLVAIRPDTPLTRVIV
jgi:hypothetical protein